MDCPKCASRTTVYNGFFSDGKYIRRRRCPICEFKFITVEQMIDIPIQGNGKRGGKRVGWIKEVRKHVKTDKAD